MSRLRTTTDGEKSLCYRMIDLFSHNLTAYESAIEILAEIGKAAIVHPTGTGKSFIAFKLCEDNPDKRVLWLGPSEYIFKTQLENLKEATAGGVPKNIVFYTYAKLGFMYDDEIAALNFDYIILDEFHRCGAEIWGRGVRKVLTANPIARVLGLSATNIRYLDNCRDMADELFDGNIASEMTLGEAVVRGILNPPKYVLSVFKYQKDLDKYSRRIRQAKSKAVKDKAHMYLETLRRALDKADGLSEIFYKHISNKTGKYIVFCASVSHMNEMLAHVGEWFGRIDGSPHVYKAYSDDPSTSKAFAAFKTDKSEHLKLLFCIDMLNEGVHVEDISGVIMLRPTASPIIYKQQIGRALSASKKTSAVIFDIVMNIEGLYSISSVQEEMQVVMTYYRNHGKENLIVNDKFEIVDEVRDCLEAFNKLNDTLSASWDCMFTEAKEYYVSHGSLEMPTRYKTESGYSLGRWVLNQRKIRRGECPGFLSKERIGKLDSIGMIWESRKDTSWKRYYGAAKDYYYKNGNLDVAAIYKTKNGVNLGSWLARLRLYRKNGIRSDFLTAERISELDKIGMVWSVNESVWDRNYGAAKTYYVENGDLDVPLNYVSDDGTRLGLWIRNLRNSRKNGNNGYRLTLRKIADLNDIGMIWETKSVRAWERGYAHAENFYNEYGNLGVVSTYVADDGYRLGAWICDQRSKKTSLSKERVERLERIGMSWSKSDSWDRRYGLAKAYYDSNGNLNVPAKYIIDGVWLNKWLNEQKQIYNGKRVGKTLTQEQIERLEAIGMVWGSAEISGDGSFSRDKRFGNIEDIQMAVGK